MNEFKTHYLVQVDLQIRSQNPQIKELIDNYGKLMDLYLSTKNKERNVSVIINDNESIDLLSTTLNNTVLENTNLKSSVISCDDMLKKIGIKNLELAQQISHFQLSNVKLQNQVNILEECYSRLVQTNQILESQFIGLKEKLDHLQKEHMKILEKSDELEKENHYLKKENEALEKQVCLYKLKLENIIEKSNFYEKNGHKNINSFHTDFKDPKLVIFASREYENIFVDKSNKNKNIQNQSLFSDSLNNGSSNHQSTPDFFVCSSLSLPDKCSLKIETNQKGIHCISYDQSGTYVATGGDYEIDLWNWGKENHATKLLEKYAITSIEFCNENLIASSVTHNSLNLINIHDFRTHNIVSSLNGHSKVINCLKFSMKDNLFLSGSSDLTIRLWDVNLFKMIKCLKCQSTCRSIDSCNLNSLIVSGHQDGSLKFWSKSSEKPVKILSDIIDDCIVSVESNFNGSYVLTNSVDNKLRIIDTRNYQIVSTISNEEYYNTCLSNHACFSIDSENCIVGGNSKLFIFDKNGNLTRVHEDVHKGKILSVQRQPCGNGFSSIDSSGILAIWC